MCVGVCVCVCVCVSNLSLPLCSQALLTHLSPHASWFDLYRELLTANCLRYLTQCHFIELRPDYHDNYLSGSYGNPLVIKWLGLSLPSQIVINSCALNMCIGCQLFSAAIVSDFIRTVWIFIAKHKHSRKCGCCMVSPCAVP